MVHQIAMVIEITAFISFHQQVSQFICFYYDLGSMPPDDFYAMLILCFGFRRSSYLYGQTYLNSEQLSSKFIINPKMGCTQCHECTHECKKCMKPPPPRKNIRAVTQKNNTTKYVLGTGLKGKVKEEVDDNDDFLTHHLQNEASITKHASAHKIRARQIIEHYVFSDLNHAKDSGSVSTSKLTQFAIKAWFQRTFLQVLERAQRGFLKENRKYNDIRQQVAEEYIFEIYQMGEFINAGFGRFSTSTRHIEIPLSLVLLNSDSALFALLGKLQQKYPLVSDVPNIAFPEVKNESSNINVLTLINSKCYEDPENLNRQSLMDDLKLIIDQANDLYNDFKDDMKDMLGPQTETDCKVKRKNENHRVVYSAEAVRRCFVKWSQKMIDLIPEVYTVKEFIDFVKSKKVMANEFIFNGTVSPTTHQQVIDSLSELLESLKYKNGTREREERFGLFIYDFLRCKTTRKTGEEVVDLLKKMKSTKLTKSGKRFEVVRVKNRFKWATRDILINFRYGQHLIGQAQLCVDVSHDDPDLARQIKFRHYLYELERGLFGPTFEMIMQYEDFTRKDIVVTLETEGKVSQRVPDKGLGSSRSTHHITTAQRKCPQNHDMIAITGDIFAEDKLSGYIDEREEHNSTSICDFCFTQFPLSKEYHYCYYCSIFYCTGCSDISPRKSKDSAIELSCRDHRVFKTIQTQDQFSKLCQTKKGVIVIFCRNNGTPSRIYLDSIAYLFAAFRINNKKLPDIYIVNVSKKPLEPMLKKYNIERTPTTIIFNEKQKPLVTLVGASFHDIESLFKVRERIAQRLPKGLKIKCTTCHETMLNESGKDRVNGQCQVCMDTNKIDDLKDIVRMMWLNSHDFFCKNGHVRCAYCSYLSNDGPSYYRDFTGRTYLSNKYSSKPSECSNGHQMKLIPEPKQFYCSSCARRYKGNEEEMINVCEKCQEYICNECQQTDIESLKAKFYRSLIKQIEVVTHFVEDRLEESYSCGCGKYFLKVYQSRKIDNKMRVGAAVKEFIDEGAVRWKCFVCNQEQTKLKVHLACFYCSYAEALRGKPSHIEICINCASKSGLIGRTATEKVYQKSTSYTCKKNHPVILTSLRDSPKLYFECSQCRVKYYPYTERYECRTCKEKICIDCSENYLIDKRVFRTDRKCMKKHALQIVKKAPKLGFCTYCRTYLRDAYFSCSRPGCNEMMCLRCSGGIDTTQIQSGLRQIVLIMQINNKSKHSSPTAKRQ